MLDFELSAGRHRAKLYYLCNFQPEDKLLDIGCGCGQLIYWAAQICKLAVGIDSDIARRKKFLKSARGEFVKKIDYQLMDIDAYQPKEKFTIITMFDVIEHITEEQFDRLLPKIIATLPQGGRFISFTPSLPTRFLPINSERSLVITGQMKKDNPGIPPQHIMAYTLWGLIRKITEAGLVITAAFHGTKGLGDTIADIRTEKIKELGLHIIARKL